MIIRYEHGITNEAHKTAMTFFFHLSILPCDRLQILFLSRHQSAHLNVSYLRKNNNDTRQLQSVRIYHKIYLSNPLSLKYLW